MSDRNIRLTILKAIGIIAVISCHLGKNIFKAIGVPIFNNGELFPEYSYQIPLFIFASGYFYKSRYKDNILDLAKKRLSLIKDYFNINIFYFILSFILVNIGLLNRNIDFNIKSLLVEPFLGGFQFYFNGPGWFVPFIFLLQIIFCISRKLIKSKDELNLNFNKEFFVLLIFIFVGFISTYLCTLYPIENDNVTILHSFLRVLFGLQFFQLGYFYRHFIERNINYSFKSFLLLVGIKIVFISIFGNYTFSLRTLKFENMILLPLFVSILGIVYTLYLTEFIVKIFNKENSKFIKIMSIIGENTWSIMMHHLLVKWCLLKIYNLSFMPDFAENIGTYFLSPVLCILIPIGFSELYKYITRREYKDKYKNEYEKASA